MPIDVHVLIAGSGFGGLATAHGLLQAGIDDLVILERGDEIGGTWRDNHYPGAACDVPSHLYSFSFFPRAEWSRSYSPQSEIQDYLLATAERFGLRRFVRFGQELITTRWLDDEQRWQVLTSDTEYRARFLVSATGALSDPVTPDLPGMEQFGGHVFHSAQWRHDVPLTGLRVAVVGTGASAIQIVPALAGRVGQLTLFQRTPAWVIPRGDWKIGPVRRFLYRHVPFAQRAARAGIFTTYELGVPAFSFAPWLLNLLAGNLSRAMLRLQVRDRGLRAKLTPSYAIGCKRILKSNTYFRALARPDVELVDAGVTELTSTGVVAANGEKRDVDAIVFSTGFAVQDLPIAHRLRRRDGRFLADVWAEEGMAGLRGTTVEGCPNLFLIVGPNTGVGHTSMIYVIESQVRYVVSAIRQLRSRGLGSLEPAPEALATWNTKLQKRLGRTVWNRGGCASWYLDRHGRNSVLWPGSVLRLRQGLRQVRLAEYRVEPVRARRGAAGSTTAPTRG